jgi:hypothetical protein
LTLPHDSIGMSPFELLNAYPPRTSFDWKMPETASAKEQLNREEAQEVLRTLQGAWETARSFINRAQEKKERDINPYRRTLDFEVGDKV